MKDIVKKVDDSKILLSVNNKIYDDKAIIESAYRYSDVCFIYINKIRDEYSELTFTMKENINKSLEIIVKDFCNELIDQQLRIQTEKEYKVIREEIVKKAFRAIS